MNNTVKLTKFLPRDVSEFLILSVPWRRGGALEEKRGCFVNNVVNLPNSSRDMYREFLSSPSEVVRFRKDFGFGREKLNNDMLY